MYVCIYIYRERSVYVFMYSYYVFMCLLVFPMYLCINLHVYIVHMLYTLCITSCTPSLPVYIDILHTHISPCVYIYMYIYK